MIQSRVLPKLFGPSFVSAVEAVTTNSRAYIAAEKAVHEARRSLNNAQSELDFHRDQLDLSERHLAAAVHGLVTTKVEAGQ